MANMAFPTETDLRFFESKRVPRWAKPLIEARAKRFGAEAMPALIDDVVNAHAGLLRMTSGECAAHNLLSIVRSFSIVRSSRRRGLSLEQRLEQIAQEPGCLINPEKRSAFARKWARCMQRRAT